MRLRSREITIALAALAGPAVAVAQTTSPADAAKVSAWATGGATANGRPGASGVPYWQAPALPTAVIQGGSIPPGWQPQPIAYQGVGPDGRVVTQYFAPTYTFTYQSGPPVLAVPQAPAVNRRQVPVYRGSQPYGTAPAAYAPGWNSQPQAAAPVSITPPPPTVARYAPPPPPPVQPPGPPPGWAPATAAPPPMIAPAAPSPAAGWAAAAAPAAVAAATPPPTAALAPVPAPADAAPAMQRVTSPSPAAARPRLWRVVGVQDGDTVTCLDDVNQQRKVGLADIDAPEIAQDYGKTAREALAGMVFGRTVEVGDAGATSGGPTARLFVDGVDVSRQMVATGNAWQDPASADSSLAAAQAQARAAKLGLWTDAAPTPPWTFRGASSP